MICRFILSIWYNMSQQASSHIVLSVFVWALISDCDNISKNLNNLWHYVSLMTLPSCFHTTWWFMTSKHCLYLSGYFCLFLRTGEIGCPLYNRAEGGHKDCQQRETLRISLNEGTKLTSSVYLTATVEATEFRLALSDLQRWQQK